ncbi:ferredoxin-fold anticodon-binding domain-containing protein 1 [Erpetoichthys calabaricus]|uniref:phenylalanine--tRNA ligase n=1 Tax=Erpetoichthys calabaricus TaxID=27687 RepID=A0A8C4STX2_ERPCA|nr:ferredoxin-fold anticodon-binding domain-containing protein 1 [Erpetoichthys calabaricus]
MNDCWHRKVEDQQKGLSSEEGSVFSMDSSGDSMKPTQHVLLVGEGNFSFSASLCKTAEADTQITATCYESEEEAKKQEGACKSIQCLEEKGAEVFFNVDSTKLAEFPCLADKKFSCIIFNFPHYGRKAGVKKNRILLASFFLSCADVLTQDGEVHIALCNGQGGTPADQPMREWHNSWQVVAMAAEAGFILSKICPFDSSKCDGYRSTGYRSQDKSFHTEAALNHIFTRSLQFLPAKPVVIEERVGKELVSFQVPGDLCEYMNRNFLDKHSEHPVNILQQELLKEVGLTWPVQRIEKKYPLLFKSIPSAFSYSDFDILPSYIYWVRPIEIKKDNLLENMDSGDKTPAACAEYHTIYHTEEECEQAEGVQSDTSEPELKNGIGYALRPSLRVHIKKILQQQDLEIDTIYAHSGQIFKRCPISPNSLPSSHEALLIQAFDPSKNSEAACKLQVSLESAISTMAGLMPDSKIIFPREGLLSFQKYSEDPRYHIYIGYKTKGSGEQQQLIGSLVVMPHNSTHTKFQICVISLNLDLLSMLIFNVNDWRMLWTWDQRFISSFGRNNMTLFKEFSLYPPSYSHDVSFWVETETFDELEFHALVRQVSCGTVREVTLVDSFQHPHMGHASQCYRLIYQSSDRALSYRKALELQLLLRRELQQRLLVTLR